MELQTSTGLRAEVRAASNAAMALIATRSSLKAVIAAVKQAITEARLAAARTGDPIKEAAPAEKAALAELLEERDTLAERHHAAHENAALLAIRAESALISEVSTQIAKPGPTCNRLSRWPKPRRPPTSSSLRGSSALRRRDDAATRRFWRQSGARSCRRCEPKRREGRGGGGGRRFFVQSACNDRYAARDIRPASVLYTPPWSPTRRVGLG